MFERLCLIWSEEAFFEGASMWRDECGHNNLCFRDSP
jgi:hypothetical protein